MLAQDGVFKVGGIPVTDLAQEFGSPLYVYDQGCLETQFKQLSQAITYRPFQMRYACKANGNLALMRLFREWGLHFDAASPGEMNLAERVGCQPAEVLFTGNSVTDTELRSVHEKGILINMDSLSQIRRFGRMFPGTSISLRIDSDIGAGHHEHVITGGPDSKFGISVSEIKEAREIAEEYSLQIIGLHQHIGSGILEAEVFFKAMEPLLEVARRFEELTFLNLGGGLGIPYAPTDSPLDVGTLGRGISEKMDAFCNYYGSRVRLELEPGRFLVGPSGFLLTQVNTIKQTSKHTFAGTDSGFNHLIRHPLYKSYHRILNATRSDGPIKTVAVCGNLCESGDLFTHGREIVEPREGDILAICDVGAYGYSMSFTYNMRPRPAEVLISQGRSQLIRRRESIEDLFALFEDV